MSELFLKNYYNPYNLLTISYNQFIYTCADIHRPIHTAISVDLLALSRHSNLLFYFFTILLYSTFCFHFSTFNSNLILHLWVGPFSGTPSLRSPSLLNQVIHDMMLFKY